ncbi:MAG: sialate O-acetylesterase [Phycisphaeraceae bacterium]
MPHRLSVAVPALITWLAILCFAAASSSAAEKGDDAPALPKKENFHLFLLAGQSNMAGRGVVEAQDKVVHPRVLMLTKEGTWKPAVDPMHFDKGTAGVGLGRTFAITLAEQNKDITIGLIPAACGGSPITAWRPGEYFGQTKSHPYDDAVSRAARAMKQGTLKAILWHQGESDCNAAAAPKYQVNLADLIARFRKDLGTPDVPFIIGQLGQFPASPWNEPKRTVDAAHQALAKESKTVAFVSSDELTCNKDNVHFDAASLRTFGKRYAEAYRKLGKD